MARDLVHHLAAAYGPTYGWNEPRSDRPVGPSVVARVRAAWARRGSARPDPIESAIARWSGVDGDDLERLRRYLSVVPVKEGRVLIEQGAQGKQFFVLCSGQVAVTIDGEPRAVLTETDHFGELALLRDFSGPAGPRRATVQAFTDCVVAVANPAEFSDILREFPELASRIRARSQTFTTLEEVKRIVAGAASDATAGPEERSSVTA